jgi:hypothetical protein
MDDEPTCYAKLIDVKYKNSKKIDYVIHTAAPFFEQTTVTEEVTQSIVNYRDATKALA